jgi:RsiW-degrading membrane proteinase PrsW (M82 family)
MDVSLALTGAIPALVAMAYVDRLDAKRPEPRATLRRVALAGALSTIPCVIAGLILMLFAPPPGTYGHALYESFVVAGGVEELAKVLVVYWFVWHKPEFDERLDGIVYAARAGLGFALVENVLYLLSAEDMGGFVMIYLLRAFLAVPGHAIWAGIMGYFAARRRLDGDGPGLVGGFIAAVVLHGSYDAAIFLGDPLRAAGLDGTATLLVVGLPVGIIGGAIYLRHLARLALAADDAAHSRALQQSAMAAPLIGGP